VGESDYPERFIAGEERWATFRDHAYRMRYLFLRAEKPCGKPPVIFVHGFLGFSFSWRFNLREFARERDVYAVDLLGIGYSDHPPRGSVSFSFTDSAHRLLEWMQALKLSNVDLIATSHGGAVAIVMAAIDEQQHLGAIGRLVLVAPANPYSKRGRKRLWFFNTAFGALVLRVTGGGRGGIDDFALGTMYGDSKKLTKETRRGYRQMLSTPGSLDYALAVIGTWNDDMQLLRQSLKAIEDKPTLLVWGEKDITVPTETAAQLASDFHKAKLVIMPGSGHLPYEEDPELFNRTVLAHLDSEAKAEAGS
jgi:pimeloyl-ACP methyl ester carboxylesterase